MSFDLSSLFGIVIINIIYKNIHIGTIKASRKECNWFNKRTLLRFERRDIESNKDGKGGHEEN